MRTVKRDRNERLYKRGLKAGLKGHSSQVGIPANKNDRVVWLQGWTTGHEQYEAGGYTGVMH